MYAKYEVPFHIKQDAFSISLEPIQGKSYQYQRIYQEESVEKMLVFSKGELLIHPVEPFHSPQFMTSYLQIEFEKKLILEPQTILKIFLTFPINIAVLIHINKEIKIIDCISLVSSKFTLYGEPRNGVICKYWKSELHETIPDVNPFQEGVIELTITNTNRTCEEVTHAIFNAYGMKLYFNARRVAMKARMIINDDKTAETKFLDTPLERDMKKAQETYVTRKLSMISPTFLMEYGI